MLSCTTKYLPAGYGVAGKIMLARAVAQAEWARDGGELGKGRGVREGEGG